MFLVLSVVVLGYGWKRLDFDIIMCNSHLGVSRFTCAILNSVLVIVIPYYLAIQIQIQNRVAFIYYMGSVYLLVW